MGAGNRENLLAVGHMALQQIAHGPDLYPVGVKPKTACF
jgi:hypothetical protein